ncbi:MAG: hypothetical protein L0Y66_21930 [Myxococcaceae bacterium]|nr:hypothetical protein [Myxococcaceae bacterium]MCI0672299.1 hypothetical protein [Myxococcaceae bacterium]
MRRSRGLQLLALMGAIALPGLACTATAPQVREAQSAPATQMQPPPAATRIQAGRTPWVLRPSEAYDALLLLNVLRGDEFYSGRYPAEYQRFSALLNAEEKVALAHLTQRISVQEHKMVGPQLVLVFSSIEPVSVDSLVATVEDDAAWQNLRRAFGETVYGKDKSFAYMDDVRGDLRLLLGYLRRVEFSRVWREEFLPQVQEAISKLGPELTSSDVVRWDEEILGRDLGITELNAHVLKFVQPHGIRVVGWNFLTDLTYPLRVTVKTAVHELLHPPFPRQGDIDAKLTALEADPFYQRLVKEHDPAFGYTSAKGLTEEDLAEGIDVFVSERQGMLTRKGQPWTGAEFFKVHDDGMHVLAFIVYQELKRADFSHWTTYEDFLRGLFNKGVFAPGKLEAQFRSYPDSYPVKALKEAEPAAASKG